MPALKQRYKHVSGKTDRDSYLHTPKETSIDPLPCKKGYAYIYENVLPPETYLVSSRLHYYIYLNII